MQRGDLWWANLPDPVGSGPGSRRPVLVIQADSFNRSRISTVVVAIVTKNTGLAFAPGNVFLPAKNSTLPLDSVINVSQVTTIDKFLLTEFIINIPASLMTKVDNGLRRVIDL